MPTSGYAKKTKGTLRRKRRRRMGRIKKYKRAGLQLYRDVKMLKNFINTEFGYNDGHSSSTVDNNGTFVLFNGLTKGDDAFNREGRSVRFKSLQLKLTGLINGSATDTRLRFILFIDKSPQGTQPPNSELLELNTNYIDSYRNLAFRKRFVILKNWVVLLDSNDPHQEISHYQRIDLKTIYNGGNAGGIADIESNALYMYVVSDETVNTPGVVVSYRVRFIDN